jgi:hypothetical protein
VSWQIAVATVCIADLFLFGCNYNPAIPLESYFPETPVTRFLRGPSGGAIGSYRVLSLEEEFPPNVLARYRIADLRNYDAIELRSSLDLFERLWPAAGRRTSNAWTTWERVNECTDLLRLANVRYVISTTMPAGQEGAPVVFGKVMVQQLDRGAGVVSTLPGVDADPACAEPAVTGINDYGPGRLHARVRVPDGHRLLVFSEAFMPGWRAWVDGRSSDVWAYRGALNSVAVSPGEHDIQFEYRPASFRIGTALSITGSFVVILFMIGGYYGPRERVKL